MAGKTLELEEGNRSPGIVEDAFHEVRIAHDKLWFLSEALHQQASSTVGVISSMVIDDALDGLKKSLDYLSRNYADLEFNGLKGW